MKIYDSPWGKPDQVKRIAYGISEIKTPTHGGFKLSGERMKEIEKRFPTFTPWAGACWLEEDSDVVFAIVTWPELWTPKEVKHAVKAMSFIYDGKHLKEMEASCSAALKIVEGIAI